VPPRDLAHAVADWLDPHGLWSAAPDAPPARVLERVAPALLDELRSDQGHCTAADEVGRELAGWVGTLRAIIDERIASTAPRSAPTGLTFRAASTTPFEDGDVVRPARELAPRLAASLAEARAGFGRPVARFVDAAVERYAPELPASRWAEAVLASAVRAYVPLVDPHGAWAPADELTSIYDVALEGAPPSMLWEEMTRTPIGIRVDRGATAPLVEGDVVLAIEGVPTAGMSVEQANQLAIVPLGARVAVVALGEGDTVPRELTIATRPAPGDAAPHRAAPSLGVDRVPFGDGKVAVIAVPEVPDDLGNRMEETLSHLGSEVVGVVLDLRGNGGGSTDGALEALAPFLPGAPLFPMRRRDGSLEVDRAPMPIGPRWDREVAAVVDEETASAAEMIAAALASYGRGVVVGRRTYGKGCAQEYLDDDASAGLLRLTTLVFARPDGQPMQRAGIVPDVSLGTARPAEREGSLHNALAPWTGPDVRTGEQRRAAWPSHGGRVGPCADAEMCRALTALGSRAAAARAR
jgi:carboxyl-terminal processing protease